MRRRNKGGRTREQRPRSSIKHKISDLDKLGLVAIIMELFDLSPDNKRFLLARFQCVLNPKGNSNQFNSIQMYEDVVSDCFYDQRGNPRQDPSLVIGRKAIRNYLKATNDKAGTAHLQMRYIEIGTRFSLDFGEDESLFNSLSIVFNEVFSVCSGKNGAILYKQLRTRFLAIRDLAMPIGWGYGDEVCFFVDELERQFVKYGNL